MNQRDNSDEQEDKALFLSVLMEASNKCMLLQDIKDEHTYLEKGVYLETLVSLTCLLHIIFSINPLTAK